MSNRNDVDVSPAVAVGIILSAVAVLIAMIMGSIAGFKAFNRYQVRADADNKVKVTAIQIRNQEQRVKVAEQEAEIRRVNASGVRAAQDEIAKTLTPLYVQFEMTEALKEIAKSGSNSSVVYIPAGAAGIPLVAGAQGPSVQLPTVED